MKPTNNSDSRHLTIRKSSGMQQTLMRLMQKSRAHKLAKNQPFGRFHLRRPQFRRNQEWY